MHVFSIMMCPKCDSILTIPSIFSLSVNRSKIQPDDKNCTFCGSELVEKIEIECPKCKLTRRRIDETIINIANFSTAPLCNCCAGCGHNFTTNL